MVTSETPSLFYGADTPQYTAGADTPQYGGETPSSRTPRSGFEDSDGVWGVSARDRETAEGRQTGQGSSSSMQGTPGDSRGYNSAQHSVSSMSAQHQSTDSSAYGTGYGQQQSPALSHQSQSSRANADAGSISDRTYSTVPSHMSMSTSHEDVTCRDWAPGVVLQVKAGSSVGALAVVQQAVNETGRLTGDSSLHFDDLELAPPAKRERVLLLCGKDRGKIGQVTKVIGKELAVLLDGAEGATLVRTRHAAWLNPKQ
ncbi:hypothetical protein B484DRAFT_445135 [Ochromonadaceae sp. CCMP2298]|nr:hypothetical protein B484DRAFT_445135 [Ochromonadaceae sp. CCMP2298]